jgi:galactose mutarotase-like enzyme
VKKTIGSKDTFAVVSSLGGIVTEFVWRGSPIIYPERTIGEKSRGGIPICFPFFGSPSEKFSDIPKHGWLRKQNLSLMWAYDNSVKFAGINEPTQAYPWILRYAIEVRLDLEKGLKLIFSVKRIYDMQPNIAPINPAFHPYFNNLGKHVAVIGEIRATEFQKDAVKIASSTSIFINSGKWIINMELGVGFNADSCVTLWSDDAEKYFCVEPVLTYPSRFANSDGGKFLYEDEESEISLVIKPTAEPAY